MKREQIHSEGHRSDSTEILGRKRAYALSKTEHLSRSSSIQNDIRNANSSCVNCKKGYVKRIHACKFIFAGITKHVGFSAAQQSGQPGSDARQNSQAVGSTPVNSEKE
jgi:hypothetical protein